MSIDQNATAIVANQQQAVSGAVGLQDAIEKTAIDSMEPNNVHDKIDTIGDNGEKSANNSLLSEFIDDEMNDQGDQASQATSAKPSTSNNRSKSIHADQRVRLRLDPPSQSDTMVMNRQKRISVPVARYNYGSVRCCVCHKPFYQDISIQHYSGNVICSFECHRRSQR